MKNLYLDFRLCGILLKRFYLFEPNVFINTSSKLKPFKNVKKFDLKVSLKDSLEITSKDKLIFNGLKTNIIKTKTDIFFNYNEYTIYINNLNPDNFFNNNSIVSNSKAMKACIELVKKISKSSENVFIYGETGVGKEYISKLIHFNSFNNASPFLVYNVALFQREYDFLGLKKGAYSNSYRDMKSIFEKANDGIIVLDNLDELDLKSQAILLRIVDNKYIKNLGSDTDKKVKLRIIAISNSSPYKLIEEGKLRKDLFYRLSTYLVKIPNLIDRLDDLDELIDYLKEPCKLSYRVLNYLKTKYYEGNLRELINLIDKLKINSTNNIIDVSSCDTEIISSFY